MEDQARREATYHYRFPGITGSCEKHMYRNADGSKRGVWVGRNGRPVEPYGWHEVTGKSVAITEGEKDVETMLRMKIPAISPPDGAGSWNEKHAALLVKRGIRRVTVVPDMDEAGKPLPLSVIETCKKLGIKVKVCQIPAHYGLKDVTECVENGWARENIIALIEEAEEVLYDEEKFISLSDVEDVEPEFTWTPYLPKRGLTVFFGDPDAGKSFVTLAIAKAISVGEAWPGQRMDGAEAPECAPLGKSFFFAKEDVKEVIRRRFARMGGDLSKLLIYPERIRLDERGYRAINLMFESQKPKLAVFDPIDAFISGKINTNISNQVRDVLSPLADMAEKHDMSIIFISHMNKTETTTLIYRLSGSGGGFMGSVRSAIYAAVMKSDDNRVIDRNIFHVKSNQSDYGVPLGYRISRVNDTTADFNWTGASGLTLKDFN